MCADITRDPSTTKEPENAGRAVAERNRPNQASAQSKDVARAPMARGTGGELTPAVAGVLNSWVDDARLDADEGTGAGETRPITSAGSIPSSASTAVMRSHSLQSLGAPKKGPLSDPGEIQRVAQSGFDGMAGPLPYRNQLESSYGVSLDHVKAYTGPQAKQAADQLSANAYAYNGAVVLGEKSDLKTVAEETAHVLQQSSGLPAAMTPGLTDPAGAAEMDAQSAADSVAQGERASISSGLSATTVARNPSDKTPEPTSKTPTTTTPTTTPAAPEATAKKTPSGGYPTSRSAVRAEMKTRYGKMIAAYETASKTASAEYLPLIEQVKAIPAGTMSKERDKELMGQFLALSKKFAALTGSTEGADLRGIYQGMEPAMEEWQQKAMADELPKEEIARLSHMWREEKKIYVRELMTDTNAVTFLNGRDTALYGQPMGPRFEQLMEKARATGATDDQAYDSIIGSSTSSNKQVNATLLQPKPTESGEGTKKTTTEATE